MKPVRIGTVLELEGGLRHEVTDIGFEIYEGHLWSYVEFKVDGKLSKSPLWMVQESLAMMIMFHPEDRETAAKYRKIIEDKNLAVDARRNKVRKPARENQHDQTHVVPTGDATE